MRIETQGLKNKVAKTQGLKRCLSLLIMQLKFIGKSKVNYLIYILTLFLTYRLKISFLIGETQRVDIIWNIQLKYEVNEEIRFELKTFGSDTMLNHHLFRKLKLIERDKFNHLINILT
jgi:hypothetical protein